MNFIVLRLISKHKTIDGIFCPLFEEYSTMPDQGWNIIPDTFLYPGNVIFATNGSTQDNPDGWGWL